MRRRRFCILLLAAAVAAPVAWYGYRYCFGGNFDEVVPGQVYRSGQPTGRQIEDWTRRYGLKTVINLRGENAREDYQEEFSAAGRAGLKMVDIRCSAAHQPSSMVARQLIDAIETSPRPMLIHCWYGADRTGLACTLAAMAIGGQDYRTAKGQMSARYGHIDIDPEHIGGMLNAYEEYCQARGLPTAGWRQFRTWAMDVYHPTYFFVEIVPPQAQTLPAGQPATVKVTITNRSTRPLPLSNAGKKFFLVCFSGSSIEEKPDKEFGPRMPLTGQDLAPGASLTVDYPLSPATAGKVTLHFDLIEDGRAWFGREGSPVPDWPVEFVAEK